jgi:flagellar hook assembly protein FlgD
MENTPVMFPQTIWDLDQGWTVQQLGEALTKVNTAVRQTGRKASLTFSVTVEPATKGLTEAVKVQARIVTKLPEPEPGVAILYLNADNQLVRNDPRQHLLPLRSIEIDRPTEFKEIA